MNGVYALVLAAGLGSRFGGGKLTASWREGVLLDGALSVALDSPTEAVFLVVGADGVKVSAAARALAQRRAQERRLFVVTAPDFAEGLSATLRAGLAALPAQARGVLVFLGDMPLIPADVPVRLAGALGEGALAAAPIRQGQRGHPVALSRALFPALAALTGDRGARSVLDDLGEALVLIQTQDPGVLIDVDHPDDRPA